MKKKGIKVFGILIFAVVLTTFLYVCVLPKIYLAHKYHTKITDYKVVEYFPDFLSYDLGGGFYWEEGGLIYEYKVNGREFEVDFFDFQYYDSYQMEDVEKWLVDEFKKNVDENIDFVDVASTTVYGIFDKDKEKYKNVVWTRDNIGELIKGELFGNVYIKTENVEKYIKTKSFSSTNYYNAYFDTNEEYKTYTDNILDNFFINYNIKNDELNSLSERIVIHENDLPFRSNYCAYKIDLYELPKDIEKNIIRHS